MVLAASFAIAAVITGYYYFFVAEKPVITTGNRKLHEFILSHMPTVSRTFWPAFFYYEGRLQTVFGLMKRIPAGKLPYQRELLTMSDGGTVALDYLNSDKPIPGGGRKRLNVIFFPGLTSSSQTSYVKSLAVTINGCGANVIVFNNRGIGGLDLTSARTFNAVDLDDLVEALEHLKNKFPGERFLAVGTSFGTIKFGHYFTKFPREAADLFIGALFISSAFDAVAATESLETPINKFVINRTMANNLIKISQRNKQKLSGFSWFDMGRICKARTVREYDDLVTVPQFGFKTSHEYYMQSSTVDCLHKLTVPLISLNAFDDPVQPGDCLPFDAADAPKSNFALLTTKRGGHLGFLDGFAPTTKPVYFMERVAAEFVSAVQEFGEEWSHVVTN